MLIDVAIIGAGPIGLEVAVALKTQGVRYIHFEKGSIAETISKYPPRTRLYSAPAGLAIAHTPVQVEQRRNTKEEYLAYLRQVSRKFELVVRTQERVISIQPVDGVFKLVSLTLDGRIHNCLSRIVVIATGSLSMPRRLNIPGEHLPHVTHYLGPPDTYQDKQVLIVGGRNSALEAVARCSEKGAFVALSYRRSALCPNRSKSELVHQADALLRRGTIRSFFNTVPKSITPTHVRLESNDGELFEVSADHILLMIGYTPDLSLFKMAGVTLEPPSQSPVFRAETMETNIDGLYVAGTITAGMQDDVKVFVETCHPHTDRLIPSILKRLAHNGNC